MKVFAKLTIFILIFGSFQCMNDPYFDSSETIQESKLEKYANSINPIVAETSRTEDSEDTMKLLSYNWRFLLHTNGSADVQLEITLNWTSDRAFFTLTTPRTMEFRDSKRAYINGFQPYEGRSIGNWSVYPELPVNTLGTIILEFYWPLAANFYRNQWYFSSYEFFPLFPEEHASTIKNVKAIVTLPSSTQEESINVDLKHHYKGFIVTTEGTTVVLQIDKPQMTIATWMPPITYAGPPKPLGQEVEILSEEFMVVMPSVFEQSGPKILSRIEKISHILKQWLNRPEHQQRVSIRFAPPYKDVFGSARGYYFPNNRTIRLYAWDIFNIIDTLQDSERTFSYGLQTLAHEMTHSYTPWINFPEFFIEGLAEFGKYHCLMELGYLILAEKFVNYSFPSSIEGRMWNWRWGDELRGQLYSQSFYILYNLTTKTDPTIFKRFFAELEADHIRFVNGLTTSDKWRLFVRYLSRAASKNLFPFFQQWGLQVDAFEDLFVQTFYYLEIFPFELRWASVGLWRISKEFHWNSTAAERWDAAIIVMYHSFHFTLIRAFVFCIAVPFVIGLSLPNSRRSKNN